MRTWKQRYNELTAQWKVCYDRHAVKDRWIADCLEGRAKFLFRAGYGISSGAREHDWMVYRMSDGAILTIESGAGCARGHGAVGSHDSLAAAIEFYGHMSDLPHNVEMRARLAGVAADDAAAKALQESQWAEGRRNMAALASIEAEAGRVAAAEYLAGGMPGIMAGVLEVPRG